MTKHLIVWQRGSKRDDDNTLKLPFRLHHCSWLLLPAYESYATEVTYCHTSCSEKRDEVAQLQRVWNVAVTLAFVVML